MYHANGPYFPYSPKCLKEEFCELRLYGVLGGSHEGSADGIMLGGRKDYPASTRSGRKEKS
jgi:hypothetical protein